MDVDRGPWKSKQKFEGIEEFPQHHSHKNYGILMSNWEVDVIGLKEYNFNIKKSIVNATD